MTLNPKLDPSCVLCLPFEEASGSIAYDQSLYNNNGTIYGATRTLGKLREGLSFDGVDDYVGIQNSSSLNPDSTITISMWTKPVLPSSGYVKPLSKNPYYYEIDLFFSGAVRGRFTTSDGTRRFYVTSVDVVRNNIWTHVAFTFDGTVGKIFINGVGVPTTDTSDTVTRNTATTLVIGAITSINGYFFNGIIDEVRIYNRALSAKEIYEHYIYGIQSLRRPILLKAV